MLVPGLIVFIMQVLQRKYVVNEFLSLPECIEVGGPQIHTREEMAKMIQERLGGVITKFPESIASFGSQFSKLISKKELEHKLEYFTYIMSHDMIAEKAGTLTFEEYLDQIDFDNLK